MEVVKKPWGDEHAYVILDWGNNTIVGRFMSLSDAREHRARYVRPYDSWRIYRELRSLRKRK